MGVVVAELPVEVVAGDVEQDLRAAAGGGDFIFKSFSAHMHVGHEGHDMHVEGDGLILHFDMVRHTCGDV